MRALIALSAFRDDGPGGRPSRWVPMPDLLVELEVPPESVVYDLKTLVGLGYVEEEDGKLRPSGHAAELTKLAHTIVSEAALGADPDAGGIDVFDALLA